MDALAVQVPTGIDSIVINHRHDRQEARKRETLI